MRLVFMGTPDFAANCLQTLIDDQQEIVAVFTQPDKPTGRHAILTPPPVKELALKHQIPVFQPTKMKDGTVAQQIRELKADLAIVVAYGRILPKEILEAPKYGCMNVHASLLPKYRGAAPIQWSVLNGDLQTGVTTMKMDEGMDTGDILEQEAIEIGENETSGELFDRLSVAGAKLMLHTLKLLEQNRWEPKKQDNTKATNITMLDKTMGKIDFNWPAQKVHNWIRGMNPWPSAYIGEGNLMLKFHRSQINEKSGKPGTLLDDKRMIIACGDRSVEILEIQPAGKAKMKAEEYLRGARLKVGDTILR